MVDAKVVAMAVEVRVEVAEEVADWEGEAKVAATAVAGSGAVAMGQ